MSKRKAVIKRETAETKINLKLSLDEKNTEKNKIDTGAGFFNHMLELASSHGNFSLDVICKGDVNVDYHHSAEDIGIALGEAFKEALGDKRGIRRYGYIILPMDEVLMISAIDISGRAYLGYDVEFPTEKIGDFDSELIKEFFLAFVRKAEVTLHFIKLKGENSHHIAESMFKAFGRVLAEAIAEDEKRSDKIPSTKGVL